MKTLFITPHLSTGGLPRYLLQQVEKKIAAGEEVWVVEWSDIAPAYRVQKDLLKEILGDRLVAWEQGVGEEVKVAAFFHWLYTINPDVVHLEEFPETFLSQEVIHRLYYGDRWYKIFETTHDSAFLLDRKKTRPDKFEFVSSYHKDIFSSFGVEVEIVEYRVEEKERENRRDLEEPWTRS